MKYQNPFSNKSLMMKKIIIEYEWMYKNWHKIGQLLEIQNGNRQYILFDSSSANKRLAFNLLCIGS